MDFIARTPTCISRSAATAPSMHDFAFVRPAATASYASRSAAIQSSAARIPAAIAQQIQAQGGFYRADADGARQNLHADDAKVRAYLGTYLPRTAFEVQTISAELLETHRFARYLPKDRALRILDLGSGTGGAWMGFIYGACRAASVREIHIHTIDGNPRALAKQQGFAAAIEAETGIRIHLHPVEHTFSTSATYYAQELQRLLAEIGHSYDFILVSKHLNELYAADYAQAQGAVRAATQVLSTRLAPQGCLIVLEITCPPAEGKDYFPETLHRELGVSNQTTHSGLAVLAHAPAHRTYSTFTQREFDYHAQAKPSKACYFALVSAELAQRICHDNHPRTLAMAQHINRFFQNATP